VIAIFCGKLASSEAPTVYGDGEQTRDYIYVADVVDAILAAAGSDANGAFNVGTGRETSVLELVDLLGELGGNESFAAELAPARTGEVQRIALDCSRAADLLGWRAATELRDGLRQTLDAS
jgi:UDP-glucose 4-epimerase